MLPSNKNLLYKHNMIFVFILVCYKLLKDFSTPLKWNNEIYLYLGTLSPKHQWKLVVCIYMNMHTRKIILIHIPVGLAPPTGHLECRTFTRCWMGSGCGSSRCWLTATSYQRMQKVQEHPCPPEHRFHTHSLTHTHRHIKCIQCIIT